MTATPAWVVKLGGSLQKNGRLHEWLQLVADCAGVGVVLVPGGGTFADTVRHLQPEMGYDDGAAHHMAILAMAQTATALASLEPSLALADSLAGLQGALAQGRAAIWRPLDIVAAPPPDLQPGWDITADSLALWLADRLKAPRLLLVKSCEPLPFISWADWAAQDVVDQRFPRLAAASRVAVDLVRATDLEPARRLLLRHSRAA